MCQDNWSSLKDLGTPFSQERDSEPWVPGCPDLSLLVSSWWATPAHWPEQEVCRAPKPWPLRLSPGPGLVVLRTVRLCSQVALEATEVTPGLACFGTHSKLVFSPPFISTSVFSLFFLPFSINFDFWVRLYNCQSPVLIQNLQKHILF